MSGRPEVSTTMQAPDSERTGSGGLSIVVIGPNSSHRRTVAKAVNSSAGRTVREFDDYPAKLSDVPRMMEQNYDIVMIDVDTDQSYAIALVERFASMGKAMVIAYSMRNDPELLMSCMHAGAREFLPLPDDDDQDGARSSQTATEETGTGGEERLRSSYQQNARETRMGATDSSPQSRRKSHRQPDTPELDFNSWDSANLHPGRPSIVKSPEPSPRSSNAQDPPANSAKGGDVAQSRPAGKPALVKGPEAASETAVVPGPQAKSEKEWDSMWVRPGPQTLVKGPEANSRSAVTPEQAAKSAKEEDGSLLLVAPQGGVKTAEASAEPAMATESPAKNASWLDAIANAAETTSYARPRIDKRTVEIPEFRYVAPNDNRKPDRSWSHWVILSMGFGVLVCLLWLYFVHPFGQSLGAPSGTKSVASQPGTAGTVSRGGEFSAKRSTGAAASRAEPAGAPAQTTQVSSDMMDAQLSAPARISSEIKKPAPVEEPPAGLAPSAIDDGGTVPGAVFKSGSTVTVVPVPVISAGVAEGILIHKTQPVYPKYARDNRIGGTVVLKAKITKAGTLADLRVISGPRVLDSAALDAAKEWRYRPYTLNHEPVEVETSISVIFSLGQN